MEGKLHMKYLLGIDLGRLHRARMHGHRDDHTEDQIENRAHPGYPFPSIAINFWFPYNIMIRENRCDCKQQCGHRPASSLSLAARGRSLCHYTTGLARMEALFQRPVPDSFRAVFTLY